MDIKVEKWLSEIIYKGKIAQTMSLKPKYNETETSLYKQYKYNYIYNLSCFNKQNLFFTIITIFINLIISLIIN